MALLRGSPAHYCMRNRTHGSDFPSFFSAHERSRTLFAEAARVRFWQQERIVLGRGTGTISRETPFYASSLLV